MLHFLAFPFRTHALVTDVRHYVYFAARIASGGVPYRDFFDVKTPLAACLGALFYRLGIGLGLDPVVVLRVGYLILAAMGGTLAFLVHRNLRGGSGWAGMTGVVPLLGFSLLGLLPAMGNIPKLLVVLAATGVALAVLRGAWFVAGLGAAVAFLDWQVGGVVLLALLPAAWLEGAGHRRSAFARIAWGALGGLLPAVLLLARAQALSLAFGQTVLASFYRGVASWQRSGPAEWSRRWHLLVSGCPGELWLLPLAATGMVCFLWRRDKGRIRQMTWVLGGYHFGVVVFSLLDFQGFGDLFVLLHTVAFFAGIAFGEVAAWLATQAPGPRRRLLTLTLTGLLVATVRPWVWRGNFELRAATADGAITLQKQVMLARHLGQELGRRRVVFLGASELLVLMKRANPGLLQVWTPASYRYFRSSPDEPMRETLSRMLLSVGPEVLVCDVPCPLGASAPGPFRNIGERRTEGYGVVVYEVEEAGGPFGVRSERPR